MDRHTDILVKMDNISERTAKYVLILSPPKRRPRYSGIVTIWTHISGNTEHDCKRKKLKAEF